MHGEHETSQAPRTTGVVLHFVLLIVAGWILLGGGIATVSHWLGQDWPPGNMARRIVLFAFGCILFMRLTLTSFWLLKRRFDWGELVGVTFACVVYQIGFAFLGGTEGTAISLFDLVAVSLFLSGSYVNTWSEVQRKRFKDDPAKKRRLYTGGLFRFARHINYFGDTLWVIGWAMMTRNPWSAFIPVALAAGFVFFFIPSLSGHLERKYGDQYNEWAGKTKKYVPFVY